MNQTPKIFDVDALIDLLWTQADLGANVYGILDGASDSRISRKLGRSDCEYLCLYTDLPEPIIEVAPYLVLFRRNSNFTRWVLKNGWGNHWGILFTAEGDVFQAASHFRQFIVVQTEEGKRLYFRFYDPRVMRTYIPTCNKNELLTIFGPVQKYFMASKDNRKANIYSLAQKKLVLETLEF